MRGLFMAAIVGSMLAALPARADSTNGAKPDNPSGFGQAAASDAHLAAGFVGDLAQSLAHNDFGNGAGTEVQMYRALNDSTPNPPAGGHH
jgi:hypothetical protein